MNHGTVSIWVCATFRLIELWVTRLSKDNATELESPACLQVPPRLLPAAPLDLLSPLPTPAQAALVMSQLDLAAKCEAWESQNDLNNGLAHLRLEGGPGVDARSNHRT